MLTKAVKNFLKQIFCVIGSNSPYKISDFVQILLDAVEHSDFTNNTCVRVGSPTGETVFSRLKDADTNKINNSFYSILDSIFKMLKPLLRNRSVALCFDTTDEPYYGKVEGFWIHPYKPVRGSTGCFKYITVSCTDRNTKFILGSLPVRVGADIVMLVNELIKMAKRYVSIEVALFDRGFDDLRLIESLQKAGIHYQILWCKHEWATKLFKTMENREIKEINRQGKYNRDRTWTKVKMRFVLIKQYKRHKKSKAYDWVFCTNTRRKSAYFYVSSYKRRWNIETVFRVLDTIQIKTTTKNPIIRYFLNMFCCLVYNLWKLKKSLEWPITLKNFVAQSLEYIKSVISLPDG